MVLRALAKDPAERFADAEEFIAALQHVRLVLPGGGGRVPPASRRRQRTGGARVGHRAAAGARSPRTTRPETGRGPEDAAARRRRRRWWWIGGAALLALVGGRGGAGAAGCPPPSTQVTVPYVIRRTEALALEALRAQGLTPGPRRRRAPTSASGLVISRARRRGPRCSGARA